MRGDLSRSPAWPLPEIEQALNALVSARIEHDSRRTSTVQPVQITATPYRWTDPSKLPSRLTTRLRQIVSDPVRAALDEIMIILGQEVLDRTEQDRGALYQMLDRVAECDPANAGRRGVILDMVWARLPHGIGDEHAAGAA